MIIDFAIWAPDEATFWQSWIDAGICLAPHEFSPEYPGIIVSDQTSQGWVPTKLGVPVTGWHANVRVSGTVADQFTYGRPQEGDIWDRTWAAEVFLLETKGKDIVSNFPYGYTNKKTGVTYADINALSSPTNVWA